MINKSRFKFFYIKHSSLDEERIDQIVRLKMQHWHYAYDSQINWLSNYVDKDAVHLLLFQEEMMEDLLGYVLFINVMVSDFNVSCMAYGVGNVCIDNSYRHKGWGNILMQEVRRYICENKRLGILFCATELIRFYKKNGWENIKSISSDKQIFIGDSICNENENILFLNNRYTYPKLFKSYDSKQEDIEKIVISRRF